MTREEAIERFENVKASALVQKASGVSEYWQNEIDGTIKAIDMAIEALSAEPKMKVCEERQNGECPFYTPDWLDDDVSEPSDLISRADAIACLSHGEGCGHSCRNRIKALPSAEALQGATYNDMNEAYEQGYTQAKAEVVRCKDCEHWDTADGECYGHDYYYCSEENDYCSRGERKEP